MDSQFRLCTFQEAELEPMPMSLAGFASLDQEITSRVLDGPDDKIFQPLKCGTRIADWKRIYRRPFPNTLLLVLRTVATAWICPKSTSLNNSIGI